MAILNIPEIYPMLTKKEFAVNFNSSFNPDNISEFVKLDSENKEFITNYNSKDKDALNYIGVYSVGLIEALESAFGLRSVLHVFDDKMSDILKYSIVDISKLRNIATIMSEVAECIDDETRSSKYPHIFQTFFTLRYNNKSDIHQTISRWVTDLMLIYLVSPSTFWDIFMEIMTYCFQNIIPILQLDVDYTVKTDAPDKEQFTKLLNGRYEFNNIPYQVPGQNSTRIITNCREFCIGMCFLLYFNILKQYGGINRNSSVINEENYKKLQQKVFNCLGDDDQSKILKGKYHNNKVEFEQNNIYFYNSDNKCVYTVEQEKICRYFYEEQYLYFMSNNMTPHYSNAVSINMRYSNINMLFSCIGEFVCCTVGLDSDFFNRFSKKQEDQYNELKTKFENSEKRAESAELRAKNLFELDRKKYEQEISDLNNKINELNSIIETKNNTIEQLDNERTELNALLTNMYSDDIDIEVDKNISLEEQINFIKDFDIILAGGRTELLDRLHQLGLTNIEQYDKYNANTKLDLLKSIDFCVINTKFISHSLSNNVLTVVDRDKLIYYNGTNTERLITAIYDFITKYLS